MMVARAYKNPRLCYRIRNNSPVVKINLTLRTSDYEFGNLFLKPAWLLEKGLTKAGNHVKIHVFSTGILCLLFLQLTTMEGIMQWQLMLKKNQREHKLL